MAECAKAAWCAAPPRGVGDTKEPLPLATIVRSPYDYVLGEFASLISAGGADDIARAEVELGCGGGGETAGSQMRARERRKYAADVCAMLNLRFSPLPSPPPTTHGLVGYGNARANTRGNSKFAAQFAALLLRERWYVFRVGDAEEVLGWLEIEPFGPPSGELWRRLGMASK